MAIRSWHWGKIGLLWTVVLVWEAVFFNPIYNGLWRFNISDFDEVELTAAAVFAVPPVIALVFNWVWLSARQK